MKKKTIIKALKEVVELCYYVSKWYLLLYIWCATALFFYYQGNSEVGQIIFYMGLIFFVTSIIQKR